MTTLQNYSCLGGYCSDVVVEVVVVEVVIVVVVVVVVVHNYSKHSHI